MVLKREGVDVNTFASSIRLQRKLEQKGLNQEQIESFVENMDIHCFKSDLKAEEFISIINKICIISDNLGIPVDDMPEYLPYDPRRRKAERNKARYNRSTNGKNKSTTRSQCNY